ncbi:MAG: RIP metalloprotease RseP [Bacilli bacterium]|jgi:regulator of sigma E protease
MTLVYFLLILGITIMVHEIGHFLAAKKAGIYVYEFALGMGPKLFSKKRENDETIYSIRLIPLGGYVQLAGEEIKADERIPINKRLQSKTWYERFFTIISGVAFNFIFALLLLFMIGLFWGVPNEAPIINDLEEGYPAYSSGLQKGDLILQVNDRKIKTWDDILIELELSSQEKPMVITVKHPDDTIETYNITLKKELINNREVYRLGIAINNERTYGLIPALKYTFTKTVSLIKTLFIVIINLFSGNLGINKVSGPIGIYSIVGEQAKAGFDSVLYLMAFLSINVGFINLIPFPAFDGGRLLFLVIERIIGRPVDAKIENYLHTIGFYILMALMLYIAFNDIIRLF